MRTFVGDFKRQEVVADLDDLAEDAAGGDHFVARGDLAQHRLVLFLLFLLGADEQEIEDDDEHRHHDQRGRAGTGGGAASGLRHGVGNQ